MMSDEYSLGSITKNLRARLDGDSYRIDGRVPLLEISDVLGVSMAYPNIHTIGGALMHRLRHMPQVGESITISGYRFTVEKRSEKGVISILADPV